MIDDTDLLRCYAEDRSEEAFAELVSRHLSLVYSAALRQVNGDTHMAEDITQEVFTDLARKASSLARRPILASWLYTSTQFAASKAMRTLSRRRTREEEAHVMREQTHDPSPEVDWDQIRPVLDRAMHQLKQSDREAILLRFFEKHTLAEVGVRLALTEDAARMKVDRALVKLKPILAEYGIKSTVSGLAAGLTTGAVIAAPVGLSTKVAATAVATAMVSGGTGLTLLKLMSMTKLQTAVVGVVLLVGVTTSLYLQHDANTDLRNKLDQARSNSKETTIELASLREAREFP